MLGKLLKHEIKATSRQYLVLYGAFLLITIFNKLFLEINAGRNTIVNIFQGIFMIVYILMCMGIFAITIVLIIMRFYKNFLGDEGYLMFTLPAKTYELILSKLLISTLWCILSFVVFVFSIVILLMGHGIFEELLDFWRDYNIYIKEMFGNIYFTIFLYTVFCIVSIIFGIIMFYVSMAGGQLIGKYRIIGAIGIYFAISFIIQIISTCIMLNLDLPTNYHNDDIVSASQFVMGYLYKISGIYIIFQVVCSSIFFAITNYLFSKRLNLE